MELAATEFSPLLIAVIVLGLGCVTLGIFVLRNAAIISRQSAVHNEQLKNKSAELLEQREKAELFLLDMRKLNEVSISYREQIAQLQTMLEQERKQSGEKLQFLEGARERMTLEFKQLAADILEDKSRRFTVSNKENLNEILLPLNEKIAQFEKKVQETYDTEAKERFSLAKEIKSLQELNTRISTDAVNLTRALKGENKTQGTWGEVILESILEKSGLVKGREYESQLSLRAEDGSRSQPDVVVHLPENKHVIIDAKVSLKAYESFCSEEDESLRADYLKQHVQSVNNHVKLLSRKDYQNLMELQSLDFVLLFMPVEAAFSAAVQHDGQLFTTAFEKNIILVGPSTLLATLRTIQNIWRYEHQNQNAIEIANRAGAMYDKFVAFVADLEDIGGKINATQKSFDKAQNKLHTGKGNLLGKVEQLKLLGARASKRHAAQVLVHSALEENAGLELEGQ
jgi:DNA recombination protein RmuC